MYLAEIHGKFTPHEERKEDILTSNVFSFFKYARRDIFLYRLVTDLGFHVERTDASEAEFIFWPSFEDGTQPDVVIIIGNYYLVFEAKLFSRFGKSTKSKKQQLEREVEGGELEAKNINKKSSFIAVTAHYTKSQFLAEYPDAAKYTIHWLSWQDIALLIDMILGETDFLIERQDVLPKIYTKYY